MISSAQTISKIVRVNAKFGSVNANFRLKMKRYFVTVLPLILLSLNTIGQTHFIGIQGGWSRANFYSKDVYDHPYWQLNTQYPRLGFSGGLNYEYHFTNKYYIGVDLLYEQLGNNYPWFETDQHGIPILDPIWEEWYSDFFSLPVKFGVSTDKKVKLFANIGLCPSFLLQAYNIDPQFNNDGQFTGDVVYSRTKISPRFDFGGVIEAGISYPVLDGFSIFTLLRYRTGIIPYRSDKGLDDALKMHHFALSCSLGLRFRIKSI